MSEKNNNLKYVFVLIGVLALVASYFLVYNKYSVKIDDISTEIKSLKSDRDRLKEMDENKENKVELTAEINKEAEEEFKKYDGGLSYKAEIMDAYNMTQNLNIKVNALGLNQVEDAYAFGQLPSSNPNGSSGEMAKYTGKKMVYTITTGGTYDQIKKIIKYVMDAEGKRKVINSVTIVANGDSMNLNLTISEFDIEGGDRKVYDVVIPEYVKSVNNLFINEVITRTAE